jgi:hypothetical protein
MGESMMITNELEYKVAIQTRRVLEAALANEQDEDLRNTEEYAHMREGVQWKLSKLERDIAQYEALRDGRAAQFQVDFTDIDEAFILARHLRGMSQQDLGDKLGVKQQQVQRYEVRNYEQATLARLRDVAWALKCNIRLTVQLQDWGTVRVEDMAVPSVPRTVTITVGGTPITIAKAAIGPVPTGVYSAGLGDMAAR